LGEPIQMKRDYETLRGTLGRNVRRLRRERKLSQEDLAFEAEIDRTYVSQIERGVINPSLLVLWKVSRVLGVSLVTLLKQAD
jgi:transcriptional regulator with XRE-family HTH domain